MADGRSIGFGTLLLALGLGFAPRAFAQAPDPCAGQPAGLREPCREARQLLESGPQPPDAARRIRLTGSPEGWRYDYAQPGAIGADDEACIVTGALVLPADTPVRLQVTASDTIRPWRLPQFGLDLTGIPGRIEEAVVTLPSGEATGPGDTPVELRVLAPDAYAEWEGRTLPPSCFASG